ncbi:hypothetical protein C2869_03185 [Saccharobesus litoralis]|uniref:OmpR/PhoB-type domain-containing protein n=1 Tax=Saccharobesus litoralis TaxID=2172099 RepID=A0A2S0VMQ7_9ALTE|nr:winged helix-turn-helix domain-containing protein [Saccharobesus litoralis]AWB65498.1 hypothetical protein C2869_03185 [Saccharobesus litoralis]
MIYRFQEFSFDSNKLTLYKSGQIINLRSNEANVLALLMAKPHEVVSKQDILDQVWADKVVSEQAVFQNISNLRRIFGDDAIKTFSRKGYQWQLPFCSHPASSHQCQTQCSNSTSLSNAVANPLRQVAGSGFIISQHMQRSILAIGVLVLLLLSLFSWHAFNHKTEVASPIISVLPFTYQASVAEPIVSQFTQSSSQLAAPYLQTQADVSLNFYDFIETPNLYFKQVTKADQTQLVMATQVSQYNRYLAVNFVIQGSVGNISGVVEGPDSQQVAAQLNKILDLATQLPLAKSLNQTGELDSALLELLNAKHPENLFLLTQLIEVTKDHNKGISLAEELLASAKRQNNQFYQAYAYLKLGLFLTQQGLYPVAEQKLSQALEGFNLLGNSEKIAATYRKFAIVGLHENDYDKVKKYQLLEAKTANQAGLYGIEVRAHTYLAVLAAKFKHKEDRNYYLYQAELLLDKYKMPHQHYAEVYYQKALYNQWSDPKKAEEYYQRVLAIFEPTQQHWVKEMAVTGYAKFLVRQKRWHEALALYPNPESYDGYDHMQIAHIYLAQDNERMAIEHAQESFRLLNLNAHPSEALNTALFLYGVYKRKNEQVEMDRYLGFIKQEVTQMWLRMGKHAIEKQGISIDMLRQQL